MPFQLYYDGKLFFYFLWFLFKHIQKYLLSILYRFNKICVEFKSLNQLPFEVVNLDKYLYDIKADPFFVFNNEFRIIDVKIDHSDYLDFLGKY